MNLRALALAALLGVTAPASATLQIAADINGNLFFCMDQAACDGNAAVGQLSIGSLILGGVEIIGSSQIQNIGTTNFLNTSSFQVINHNLFDSSVQLAIGGTDFLGPVASFVASGSGTWQNANTSTIGLSYYGDPANAQGADNATDFPGLLLASFNDVAVGPADAFSFNANGAFAGPGFHSMTLGTAGLLEAWDGGIGTEPTLVGRSQTIITTQVVPEPATLALMGLALAGLGAMQRRRQTLA